jgi:hypothetical protein
VSSSHGGLGLGRATLLAILSVVAFVLVVAIVYELTGTTGTVSGIPPTSALTIVGGS